VKKKTHIPEPQPEADQTVRLEIGTKDGAQSMRISFTDQRLTAYGGMVVWSQFLHQSAFRCELERVLPHEPVSNNAYAPVDTALGFLGGILSGADKLSRVAYLRQDPAIAEVLGIEAVPSQSTLSRFFGEFSARSSEGLTALHRWALRRLPSAREGYTLDLDSWSLLHKDGEQEGVACGYTREGLRPCHHPLVAALAEVPLVANFWLRRGDTACLNNAPEFLTSTLAGLPAHIRVGLVRGDSGFYSRNFLDTVRAHGLHYIVVVPLKSHVQSVCRHDDACWSDTEIAGLQLQEVEGDRPGERMIVLRQKTAVRPDAGGKELFELPGYRFQALVTNLPRASTTGLGVWRRYNGRGDIENRIKELGHQFGITGLCCRSFWATEAIYHLAITAYNLCVLLQRRLGQLDKCELVTLRWRLFTRAAVFSRAQGKPTLKLAVQGKEARDWWYHLLQKLTAPPNCHAVESMQA
jgi:hypothetical protein